jgi:hypothetical protein
VKKGTNVRTKGSEWVCPASAWVWISSKTFICYQVKFKIVMDKKTILGSFRNGNSINGIKSITSKSPCQLTLAGLQRK